MEDQMKRKNTGPILAGLLLIAVATALHADEKTVLAAPSVKKGDLPPGNARTLSVPQARAALKEAIKKRYVGTMKGCQRIVVKFCETTVLSEAADVRVRAADFDLTAPYTDKQPGVPATSRDGRVSLNFKTGVDYIQAYRLEFYPGTHSKVAWTPSPLYNVGFLPSPEGSPMAWHVFVWPDEAAAQSFADAFNRLLYAAYRNEESTAFSAAPTAWRENPAKAPLGPEAERHRILAENAIKEKNLALAIEHYESALEVQPMWPAGWFNLAIIYAEQNNYADATDRMQHYLELAPDAPDAKDAREQMIIWEEKAKH
jgi:tetratricopeptide (TPR) repeat protein